MVILKGEHGGFCVGVEKAVAQARKLSGKGNYVLGEIIHNETVINQLTQSGTRSKIKLVCV